MQLGFVLLLIAIVFGMLAAVLEVAWARAAWVLSVACGLIVLAAAWDLGYNPQGMERAWGRAAANVVPLFLWGAGVFIECMCVVWIVRDGVRALRRRKRK